MRTNGFVTFEEKAGIVMLGIKGSNETFNVFKADAAWIAEQILLLDPISDEEMKEIEDRLKNAISGWISVEEFRKRLRRAE